MDSDARNKVISGAELRAHKRVSLRTSMSISHEGSSNMGFIRNISAGGVYVAAHCLFPPGSIVDLGIFLPGSDEPIQVQGEVCWVREYNPTSGAHPGMGLRFVDLPEELRVRIEQLVKGKGE